MSGAFLRPSSLAEALQLHHEHGAALLPICGGTDLMVGWNLVHAPMPGCIDLSALRELQRIEVHADHVVIGAGVSCARIAAHPQIRQDWPMLAECARQTGSLAIQNRATLGGNIMNASPAADNPPALLAYSATVQLASVRGERSLAYDGFHISYKRTQAAGDELVVSVSLPRPRAESVHFYRKVGTRQAQAISKVALAALLDWDDGDRLAGARFGFASAAPVPLLARGLAERLIGSRRGEIDAQGVSAALIADVRPIDDIRSSALYRQRVAANLVCAALAAR
jgi:CO/xanthine dehydrogenase FAD-binding subunit